MTGPAIDPETLVEPDATLAAAVELARSAALEVGEDSVGAHLGALAEAERVVTHAFVSSLPGYAGWYWAVTLVRGLPLADRHSGRSGVTARRRCAARAGLGAL